jgi:hypothetical protein
LQASCCAAPRVVAGHFAGAIVIGQVGRANTDAATARGLDRDASARYLNRPRCRRSIRPRPGSPRIVHCPRCVARSHALVELFASALPADRRYGHPAPHTLGEDR